jgi:hypothetical protein
VSLAGPTLGGGAAARLLEAGGLLGASANDTPVHPFAPPQEEQLQDPLALHPP